MSDFGSPPATASIREPRPPPRTTICGGQADIFVADIRRHSIGRACIRCFDALPGIGSRLQVAGERTSVGAVNGIRELLPLPTPGLVVRRELDRLEVGWAQLRSHRVDREPLGSVRPRETVHLELRRSTEDLE